MITYEKLKEKFDADVETLQNECKHPFDECKLIGAQNSTDGLHKLYRCAICNIILKNEDWDKIDYRSIAKK